MPAPFRVELGEHPVFDLVPLAGAKPKVAHMQRHARLLSQSVQGRFLEPHPIAFAATAIGCNQQFLGCKTGPPPHSVGLAKNFASSIAHRGNVRSSTVEARIYFVRRAATVASIQLQ